MWIRAGLFCGSIYWVLPVSGWFSVPKPLSQIQRTTLRLLQGLSPRPSLGGFGVKQGCCAFAGGVGGVRGWRPGRLVVVVADKGLVVCSSPSRFTLALSKEHTSATYGVFNVRCIMDESLLL